jgi:hypothetical protein
MRTNKTSAKLLAVRHARSKKLGHTQFHPVHQSPRLRCRRPWPALPEQPANILGLLSTPRCCKCKPQQRSWPRSGGMEKARALAPKTCWIGSFFEVQYNLRNNASISNYLGTVSSSDTGRAHTTTTATNHEVIIVEGMRHLCCRCTIRR